MSVANVDKIKSRPVIHNGQLSWAFSNSQYLLKHLVTIDRNGAPDDDVLLKDPEKVCIIPMRNFFQKEIKIRCQYEKVESYSIKNIKTVLTTILPVQHVTQINFGTYKDEYVFIFHSVSNYFRICADMNEVSLQNIYFISLIYLFKNICI